MTESKATPPEPDPSSNPCLPHRENSQEAPNDDGQTRKIEVVLPKTTELIPPGKKTAFELQTNLPPEIALAILPHISDDQRRMLIEELGKENERQFEAFKIFSEFRDKKHKTTRNFLWLLVIVFIALTVFFTLTGNVPLLEKLIQILLAAFGGGGTVVLIMNKKGKDAQ